MAGHIYDHIGVARQIRGWPDGLDHAAPCKQTAILDFTAHRITAPPKRGNPAMITLIRVHRAE